MRIRTGPTPAYVVTDPALTRKVLVTDAAHYAKGGKIIDALRVRGSFLAFGDGRRKCIGENFAWAELQIVLATVLRTWQSFELTSPVPRPQAVVTVKPDRLTMEFRRKAAPPQPTSESPSQAVIVPEAGPHTRPTPSGS
ncbi:cytochrome P450 [Streptomyces swartbergensis]|uniref:cytochrome P450 n=1 Tax=Streptomyces swartbergensis TaxID=487165 RepID=UPI001FC9A67E|nr:cytochrome P450 [Streptomyces swartbergensis]